MAEINIKVKADTEDAKRDLGGLRNALDPKKMGLADLKAGFDLAGVAIGKAGEFIKATVTKAVEWGDAMGDLSQLTGTSVRATSEFAATMELLGIKTESMGLIIKQLTKQGLQPNAETIKMLAAQYQAIQDPVEKNAFLFKKFGRQGEAMAEVLGKDAARLAELTEAARTSGKVIDEETAAAAEKLGESMAILQQKTDGLLIKWGNNLLPTVEYLTAALEKLDVTQGDVNRAQLKAWGIPLPKRYNEEAAAALQAQRAGEQLSDSQGAVYTSAMMAADAINTSNIAAAAVGPAFGPVITAGDGMARSLSDAALALQDLKQKQETFGQGAAGDVVAALHNAGIEGKLYYDSLVSIDGVLGTSLAKDEDKKNKLEGIVEQLDAGKISQEKFREQLQFLYGDDIPKALPALDEYLGRLDRIPREITTRLSIEYPGGGAPAGEPAHPGGGGFASGTDGWQTVPPGYPNDSYPVRLTSGERFAVVPNNMTNTFNITGPTAAAQSVAIIQKQLADMGYRADARARTGVGR